MSNTYFLFTIIDDYELQIYKSFQRLYTVVNFHCLFFYIYIYISLMLYELMSIMLIEIKLS